jgi:pseudouridine synthase
MLTTVLTATIALNIFQCTAFSVLVGDTPQRHRIHLGGSSSHRSSLGRALLHATRRENDESTSYEPTEPSSTSPLAPIRLNKVFKATHSRREADALIESGRVLVNCQPVVEKGGFKVHPFKDQVYLDGKLIKGWEAINGITMATDETETIGSRRSTQQDHSKISTANAENLEYIKYWKPRGVTCTTDRSVESNIIDDLTQKRGYQPKHRVYPVGRLDKDTSGLILLTSDGRLPNSVLRGKFKQPKVYQVLVHQAINDEDLQLLRDGVVITTVAQRDGKNRGKSLTAPTLPCQVERIPNTRRRGVKMVLVEGRNRQIRKMMEALGYSVVMLHRIQFMGLELEPLQKPGEWKELDKNEMEKVNEVLIRAAEAVS